MDIFEKTATFRHKYGYIRFYNDTQYSLLLRVLFRYLKEF